MATIADVFVALGRARGLVAATPPPSGEVPIDFMHTGIPGRERVSAWCTTCLATMFACHAWAEDPSPMARTIIARARPFLGGELTPPGVRNYFAEPARLRHTTALACGSLAFSLRAEHA